MPFPIFFGDVFNMKQRTKYWTPSSLVLAVTGVLLILVGVYFVFLRPPLLPEDIRYMAISATELGNFRPHLELWLTQVFRVMGGYVSATGALMVTLAVTAFRTRQKGAALGVVTGGIASIGLMAAVNFVINSDFRWALLGIALLWACSILLFWFETKASTNHGG